MNYALTWLPDVLINAGLKVATCPGWESRGRGEMGTVKGVLCHHTATTRLSGNMPSLTTLINGRSDLPGPLSQLGLGRDGTWYVIAAGRCNHAGGGLWQGVTAGNSSFIGIEAENTGTSTEPWPEVQLEAYRRGVAAILKHLGCGAEYCAGHKEYALPRGRKPDPNFDMDDFRRKVDAILSGRDPDPILIPATEPAGGSTTPRATLRRGAENPADLVKALQKKLRLTEDGIFGPKTEAAVRVFQRNSGAVPDGIVGPKTWKLLDGIN